MERRVVGKMVKKLPSWKNSPRDPHFLLLFMCQAFDLDVFLFTPDDVNYEQGTINGQFFEHRKFCRKIVPIPPMIETWYEGLIDKRLVAATDYCIYRRPRMNKQKTHDILSNTEFADNIIKTDSLNKSEQVFDVLKHTPDIVLKPIGDSNGEGVIRINVKGKKYVLNTENTDFFFKSRSAVVENQDTAEECLGDPDMTLESFLGQYFKEFKNRIIVQPYIKCRTSNDEPFDVRVRVVKKRGGSNYAMQVFPRIGNKNGMRSNIHTGGYSLPILTFLEQEFGTIDPLSPKAKAKAMLKDLEETGTRLVEILQKNAREGIIFDIGLDIGILRADNDKGYKFVIFEANSYPSFSTCVALQNIYNGPQIPLAYLNFYNWIYDNKMPKKG
ncbi:MAG: YheC/YheD family protein [Oscillospiraceae bacterium]|jgi:hypothetical protein|nr:YheC/YheD family protein [Oscillospiraceae bacterium]